MAFQALEKLMYLEDGYRREFIIDGLPLLLLQDQGQRYLIRNQCPHRGQRLTEGDVLNGVIRCPQHGWSFELNTGACRFPALGPCLTHYPLVLEGNQIGIEVS